MTANIFHLRARVEEQQDVHLLAAVRYQGG